MKSEKPVKIYSIHYNRPEFIRWQHQSFCNHLKDSNWEMIVVNNAREEHMRQQINTTSEALGVRTIETHSDVPFSLAGKHHADSLNFVWKTHMSQDKGCHVVFMDGDCFLVAPFHVNNHMEGGVTFSGAKQQREFIYHYLTPVVILANIDELPEPETLDWEGIGVNGTRLDTGGGLYTYFLKHPEVKEKVKGMHCTWHIKPENGNMHCIPDELAGEYDPSYNIEFFGNEFLHYCRSSNWDNQTAQHHIAKTGFVAKFLSGTFQKSVYPLANGDVNNPNAVRAKEHNFQIPVDTYFGWGKRT